MKQNHDALVRCIQADGIRAVNCIVEISDAGRAPKNDPAIFALALVGNDGKPVEPTEANIATHQYPMSRPLFVLTNGEPAGEAKTLVEFLLGERGQELVKKHGYLPLKALKQ